MSTGLASMTSFTRVGLMRSTVVFMNLLLKKARDASQAGFYSNHLNNSGRDDRI